MSDRHDLRRQTKEIQEALGRYEREQLIDILVHVFRTYVVEGAALSTTAMAPVAGDDLSGLSFAQVIERLQLRLDLPELQLFEVQGGRVHVRIDGRLQPIEVPAPRTEGTSHLQVAVTPAAPPAPANAAPPPRAPGVEVREVVIPPSAVPAQAPAHASSTRPDPRPGAVRATSTSSTARPPASGPAASAPAGSAPAAAGTAAPAAPAKPAGPAEPTGTSGGGRFGLLEID